MSKYTMENVKWRMEQESLQNAVIQSAVHYGITWNEKKYKVSYEVIAKNIRPEVQVILLDE